MINGIFVPAGNLQGSEIIPFAARIVPDDVRPSDDRVNPSNFDAHATMQASLRTARQMCEDRLTRFSGIWEAILVPGFASPFNLTRRTIVVLCLLAVTAVSLGSAIWVGLTAAPPSVLRFAWLPFLVAGSHKVSAIWDYTQLNQSALNLAVFSVADFTDVRREWSVHAQETLLPASALNHGYILATSDKAKITFLFCDHLRDFIHYLHPWRWRWLAIRGVPVLLTPILAIPIIVVGLSVTPYSPPEFTPECVPTCTLINAGIYSTTMAPGKGSTIQINAGSHGSRGRITLDVESNFDQTVSPSIDGDLVKGFEKIMTQDAMLFYFTLPEKPPAGEIAVVVTMSNEAGKYSQAVVFFTSRDPTR